MAHGIAIIGLGYWGPNLLRTFLNIPGCSVRYCCDLNPPALEEVKRKFPHILTTTDFNKIISDPSIDAVVLATPTQSHFILAKKAITAGKDVLIEKPITQSSKEAWKLVALAKKNKRILMVDHTLLFNPAVLKIKELIAGGEIGEILYIDSMRTNLGLFQKDINVIFDLASHEFSIIQFILKNRPKIISVIGKSHINKQIDVAYISVKYPKNILAHVHITWLSPVKMRRMLIVGSKKMIVYDDNEPSDKLRIYDRGINIEKSSNKEGQIKIGYRIGDLWLPNLKVADPLTVLAQSFIDAISKRKVEKSDGKFGAEIIEILENATKLFNQNKEKLDGKQRR